MKKIFIFLFCFFSTFIRLETANLELSVEDHSLIFSSSEKVTPPKKAPNNKKRLKKKHGILSSNKKVSASPIIPKKPRPIIILDPGHGGTDEGAKVRNLLEKKLTLRTCYLTKKHLEELGYKVILTRARDVYISLEGRVNIANRRNPSLFVSIHYNSSISPIAKGIEIFYYNSKQKERTQSSKKLADTLLRQLIQETAAASRGVKTGNFHVIRETEMPAVLIEAGFMTNVEERNLLRTQSYLNQLAKAIAIGIEKYSKS